MGIMYGIRGDGENVEHLVTVPGVVDMIVADTEKKPCRKRTMRLWRW